MNRSFVILILIVIAAGVAVGGVVLLRGSRSGEVMTRNVAAEAPEQGAADAAAEPPSEARPQAAALEGQRFAVGCRQGECFWMDVQRVESLRRVPEGELIRLVARTGTSSGDSDPAAVAWEEEARSDYVFCSRQRPAYAFEGDGGGLTIHYLDLFGLAGYQYGSANLYMRACHGLDFEDGMNAALAELGYRPGTRNDQVEGGSAEDLARF